MGDNEQLFAAIKSGDVALVTLLINSGANINHLFGMQGTPLCAAITANQPDIVQYLVRAKCDVNAKDFDGEPPLSLAISKGHDDLASLVMNERDCDLNKIDPVSLNPPLCVAVSQGNLEITEKLINAGCDVNKRGKHDNCALHMAIKLNYSDIAKAILMSKTCRVNLANNNGLCPIHLAAEWQDESLLEVLIHSCRIKYETSDSKHSEEPDILEINKVTRFEGNTALHIAILNNPNMKAIKCLLENACNTNIQNNQDQTALFLACEANRADIVTLLLGKGADPNIMGSQKKSFHTVVHNRKIAPLHLCVNYGNLSLVKKLVEHGVNLNPMNDLGSTPLMYALYRNKPDIVKYFLKEGIQWGLDVKKTDRNGSTALYAVSNCNNASYFAHKLIRLGCSVADVNDMGKYPLHSATEMDCTEVAVVLLDHGAKVNVRSDCDGCTPLHVSVSEDLVDMTKVLLFYGADMHMVTEDRETALSLAIDNNCLEIASLLIKNGLNVTREPYFQKLKENKNDLPFPFCEEPVFHEWFMRQGSEPVDLFTQCRTYLRQYFVEHSLPMKSMQNLPVPTRIKNYLMLHDMTIHLDFDLNLNS